jgi:hypothetical protein
MRDPKLKDRAPCTFCILAARGLAELQGQPMPAECVLAADGVGEQAPAISGPCGCQIGVAVFLPLAAAARAS